VGRWAAEYRIDEVTPEKSRHNDRGFDMQKSKGLIAGGIWLLAMLLGPPLQGATFDERLEAPRATSAKGLQSQFQAHFDAFRQKQQTPDPAAFIRDKASHKQWTDLFFAVTRAMDESVPLGDLAAFGLIAKPDGTYSVNLKKFPEWEPLDAKLNVLSNPEVFESFIPALKARGFRDSDVDTLRTYLATHDPRMLTHKNGRQLVTGFATRLQRQRQAGQALNLKEVMTYRYQKNSIKSEAKRQWALGLLDTLDAQRQRILASFLEESDSELVFGTPSESIDQSLQEEAQPLASGEYIQLLARDEAQIRHNMTQRAEKLLGGQQQ
jgi:hypothetical protein